MLVNQFINNLMSQHVIPFWITLAIIFIAVVEVFYFKLIKGRKYRGSLASHAVDSKLAAIFITLFLSLGIYVCFILLELLAMIIFPLLVIIGIIALIVAYFYINYLFAKRYAVEEKGKHNFKKGDKIVVIDEGFNTGLSNGQIVTFIKNASEKGIIEVKLSNGEVVSKKEKRFKKLKKKK